MDPDYEVLGQPAVSLRDIRHFRAGDSHCPGHPEYPLTSGVETTTGPLGKGTATSVGMAAAGAWLAARYNRPGHTLFDDDVYALLGDGDMMEGVTAEAASRAGHLLRVRQRSRALEAAPVRRRVLHRHRLRPRRHPALGADGAARRLPVDPRLDQPVRPVRAAGPGLPRPRTAEPPTGPRRRGGGRHLRLGTLRGARRCHPRHAHLRRKRPQRVRYGAAAPGARCWAGKL